MNLSFTSSRTQLENLPVPVHVILASQSIGRRQLLEKLGVRFRVVVTNVDEETISLQEPVKTTRARAIAKLEEILKNPRVYALDDKAKNLVIAADSMAVLGRKVYGKADGRESAKAMLKELMGHTHSFITSVAAGLRDENGNVTKRWDKTATSKVTMRKMSTAEVEMYVTRYDFTRFAGAYSLQDAPWDLITKVDGSYTNVIGLPFEIILPVLRSQGVVA
ncbi:septum formation protein Maf [Candidatus Gottesmanbacteria bacterium RBG_16_52_11]|uniref:Nucleoside triphosphate pyrophosphatase n=1 Tax=Candidatus Gottesmanbacteria bacterium RBG_16_52_11 TaxID=1798374 RepID=A0A1F5YR68_9BACT|nr:MAG: septum formation protein Maf [Candidatus Gottesmanbacteria bacterium RBG_16_52_11]